jgi:hypothetical protein
MTHASPTVCPLSKLGARVPTSAVQQSCIAQRASLHETLRIGVYVLSPISSTASSRGAPRQFGLQNDAPTTVSERTGQAPLD